MRIRNVRMLGDLIREERRRAGMTQAELAELAGVSRHWIYEVERGKTRAEIGLVMRTLDALGISLNLVPGSEVPKRAHRDRVVGTVEGDD